MSKKIIVTIGAIALGLAAGVGYLILLSDKSIAPKSADPHTQEKEIPAKPRTTEQITYPDGQKSTVYSGEIIARINNEQAVKSFGNKIKPSSTAGVYIITVEGDLLKAAEEIKKKPGVEWATPNSVVL